MSSTDIKKLAGSILGKASADAMTVARRSERARRAVACRWKKKETMKISEFIKSIFRKDSDAPPTRNVPPQSQPESRPQWFNQVSTSPATNPWGSQRDHTNDERPGAVRTRQPPFRRRRTAHQNSTRQRGQEDVHRLHRPRLRALSSNPRVGQAPERLAVPGVCQRPRRHGDSPGGVDGSTVWLRMILNRPDASTKLAAPVFYFLGFCSLLRCNNRAAFLLRCSRPCLFLCRLLLRRLWRGVLLE